MADKEKVINEAEEILAYVLPDEKDTSGIMVKVGWIRDVIALLKEQEKFVDVDALREKLGLAKDCAKCKQNTRACQYNSYFSLMDFCERFDMAIEELMQEGR